MGWIRKRHADGHAVAPSISSGKPLARSVDLVVEELGDELLVYDLTVDQAHALGTAAARVWRACNGKRDSNALAGELGLDGATVTRALDELRDCGLLDEGTPGISRRDLSVKVAKVGGAVAASPLIVSLAAPGPAVAQDTQIAVCTAGEPACGTPCTSRPGGCECCMLVGPTRPASCPGGTEGTGNCCLPPSVCVGLGGTVGEGPPV